MALAAFASPSLRQTSSDLLSLIGNTPLIRLERMAADFPGVEIYGKAEFFNPGGSVKDRAGLNMILEGERSGKLTPDKILLDATSGNTGIAYAMIGASKGYKVKLCLPEERLAWSASRSCRPTARRWSSPIPAKAPTAPSASAAKIYEAEPGPLLLSRSVQQSGQLAGPLRRHRAGNHATRPTAASRTSWPAWAPAEPSWEPRAGLGAMLPQVKCISAQPSSGFHGLEGLKHMPTAIVPGIYDPELADDNIWIETEDAYDMMRRHGPRGGAAGGHLVRREPGAAAHDRPSDWPKRESAA